MPVPGPISTIVPSRLPSKSRFVSASRASYRCAIWSIAQANHRFESPIDIGRTLGRSWGGPQHPYADSVPLVRPHPHKFVSCQACKVRCSQNRVSPNAPDRRAGGIPATKRALAIAAVEGGRKCVSWPFEAWATSDGAACRLLLDSRRGSDLFCRISVDGV